MQDLTTGSVTRHLIKTASFMAVTMMFQTLYFLVDLYWVGRLGKDAVAGVGVAGNLMFVVLAASQMLGVGTTALISHACGRKDRDRAQTVFHQSIVLALLIGAGFFAASAGLRGFYTCSLSADAGTALAASRYLQWFLPALALQFPMVALSSALRGTGNFVPGMVVQTATVILNMILAPLLMFGWVFGVQLGVAGAALATFVSIVLGTGGMILYFLPKDSFLKLSRDHWAPQPKLWGSMLGIGLPAGAEFALMAVYLFTVYAISRPFGAAAQAGFGIGMRVIQAGFMPVVALGFSVAPVAGQNFGARLGARVKETWRSAAGIALAAMAVFAVLCNVVGPSLIRLFSKDPAVVAVGDEYLRIISWTFVGSGIVFVNSSTFQAMGNTIPSLAASFVRILFVIFPAIVLSRQPGFQLDWIWYLSVASIAVQVGLSLFLLQREFRLRLRFDAAPGAVPSASPVVVPAGEA